MEKFLDLFKKYSPLTIKCAAAYFVIIGLFGYDLLGLIFSQIGLYFLLRLVYLAVGLAAVYTLVEEYKPEWIKSLTGKPTKKK